MTDTDPSLPAEIGQCIITSGFDHATGRYELTVDRADPRIWIASVILDQMRAGARDRALAASIGIRGDVLTIRGKNRTVVYRLTGEYDVAQDAHLAEWPD